MARARRWTGLAAGLAAWTIATAACGVTVHRAELSTQGRPGLKRLVVAGFDNLSASPRAGAALTDALVNELRRRGRFHIVESGDLLDTDRWSAANRTKEMGADAVLMGAVTELSYGPSAARGSNAVTPTVSADVRLVAAGSGDLIWAARLEATRGQFTSYDALPAETLMQDLAERVVDALVDLAES